LNDKDEPYFAKRNLDGTLITPVELPDGTIKLVEGIATGIAAAWVDWQKVQIVSPTQPPTLTPVPYPLPLTTTSPGAIIGGVGSLP
jgi:hypothetical protein